MENDFELEFFQTSPNELDLIVFNDFIKIIKEETKGKDTDTCKITYDYTYLFDDFSMEKILKSIYDLRFCMFNIENDDDIIIGNIISTIKFCIIVAEDNKKIYKVLINAVNIKHLKENFFINKSN
ncbi:hypothetical protein HBE96_23085 [Clostridium sp. P21]|uniref:Uncharacterized protein n=1 Tax=Clostridium muellerianum TaxID=2716538 RepID=A0A7Y0EL83_9CLOT|nr:hypothetical protein [Clostridium muellerianum]NMM65466.1 hypothetical protein [Clostridium muellerianum]